MMIQGCNTSPAQKVPVEIMLFLKIYGFFIFRVAERCLYVDDSFADRVNSCSKLFGCYLCLRNEKCNHSRASPAIYYSLGLERSMEKTSARSGKALICICRYSFRGEMLVKNSTIDM